MKFARAGMAVGGAVVTTYQKFARSAGMVAGRIARLWTVCISPAVAGVRLIHNFAAVQALKEEKFRRTLWLCFRPNNSTGWRLEKPESNPDGKFLHFVPTADSDGPPKARGGDLL